MANLEDFLNDPLQAMDDWIPDYFAFDFTGDSVVEQLRSGLDLNT